MERPRVQIDLPPKLAELLLAPSRYKVAHGGRGSAKSWSFARALVAFAYSRRIRVLCTREMQNSLADSVHKLIGDQIDGLGLGPWFDVQRERITSASGAEFIFKGLRDQTAKSLKSFEGIDVCWIEEAETMTEGSLQKLIPTIRKRGSEIWVSFNPDLETDPVYKRFVLHPPPSARVVEVNWADNPWFAESPEMVAERDYLYAVDPEAAAHVWGGKCRTNSDAQVLRGKCFVESFEPADGWDGPYYGADWGFSQDPTALVRFWIAGRRLMIEHEAYGVGVEIDALPLMFDDVPGARNAIIRADNARPETISYMQRHGFPNIRAVEKWSGSVEDGVAFLRQFERIVIHPRCERTFEESRLWSFKKDRLTGDVLTDLVDANNHTWDAIRYGLEPLIRQSGFGLLDYMERAASSAQRPAFNPGIRTIEGFPA